MIGCWIRRKGRIPDLTKVKSGIKVVLSTEFGKKLTIMGKMTGDGEWPSVYSMLQSGGEGADLK